MGFISNLSRATKWAGNAARRTSRRIVEKVAGSVGGARRIVGGAVRVGNTLERAVKKADKLTGGALSQSVPFIPGAGVAVRAAQAGLSGARSALKTINAAQRVSNRVGKRVVRGVDRGAALAENTVKEIASGEPPAKKQRTTAE